MANYSEFKKTYFKELIKARKKELGYLTPVKNKSEENCDGCVYMEAFSPYMNRCILISFGDERFCSVNLMSRCNKHTTYSHSRDTRLIDKYDLIEYDKMDKRTLTNAFREANPL